MTFIGKIINYKNYKNFSFLEKTQTTNIIKVRDILNAQRHFEIKNKIPN